MQRTKWYGRDAGLQVRMAITMVLLTAVYLIFSFVLFRFTRVGGGFWFGIGSNRDDDREGGNGFLVILLVSVVVAFVSHLLVMALSRYREFAADRGSAILTGSPDQLASALLRITGTMERIPDQDLRQAQPLSALFFAAPKKENVFALFSDHPTVQKRIERLQRLGAQMALR
ncbi:MAG: M48 family metalloprotease [Chloroflexi bacterium]|nr:M48 family metalloprotease [Chloroflexota bacterium]